MSVALAMTSKLITKETALKILNSITGALGVEIDVESELQAVMEEIEIELEDDVLEDPADVDEEDATKDE